MTTNAELFIEDPTTKQIPNLGVAKVGEPKDDIGWAVLRYELSSFVCEGQYAAGMDRILDSYLSHIGVEQPAAWVSGFYGSGKSHLVRVMQHLWRDTRFPDGATARGLVRSTQKIDDHVRELSALSKRQGGLWAAAGTLGSGSGSVRSSFLSVVLRAAGLPEQLAQAQCVLWMREEGILEQVRGDIESRGLDWEFVLDNMYASELAEAILTVRPHWAQSTDTARALLEASFPEREDISLDQTLKFLEKVLLGESTRPGRLPCALIVLDEMQQFINEDPDRAQQVQLLVEGCSEHFGGLVLIVATGQSALQSTAVLQKLIDRFTVQVQLSDADVESVIRQVVLAKRPDKIAELEAVLGTCSGEIDRQLAGARIAPNPADGPYLVADYPLLPARRRFWEDVLRAVDKGGKAGQLRSQLRVVHEAARRVAREPIGTVVSADFIFEEQSPGMLQTGVLLREVEASIADERDSGGDGPLRARILALVFLISQLPREGFADTGVRPTAAHIADLLVDDLSTAGSRLREAVPRHLEDLHREAKLQRVGDEYHLQTKVGQEWTQDFRTRRQAFLSDEPRVQGARDKELRDVVSRLVPATVPQGASKTPRKVSTFFGDVPPNAGGGVPVWVRNGWDLTEKQLFDLAAGAGTQSPLVFVFMPKLDADALRNALADNAAARETLATRPNPTTDEGRAAQRAMQTNTDLARRRIDDLVKEVLGASIVVQAGGARVSSGDVARSLDSAIGKSLDRLYPRFGEADHSGWSTVLTRAQQGNSGCLEAVGYTGQVSAYPVCKAVLNAVTGVGRTGNEIRSVFESGPYGWPRDAIHGALAALVLATDITAEENGSLVPASAITSSRIGKMVFRRETAAVPLPARLQVRSLLTDAKVDFTPNEEATGCARLLQKLTDLADSAGGSAPLPPAPSSEVLSKLKGRKGNDLLLGVHQHRDEIRSLLITWTRLADLKDTRLKAFSKAQRLAEHLATTPIAADALSRLEAVRNERRLLEDPDPVPPLISETSDILRHEISTRIDQLDDAIRQAVETLADDLAWGNLTSDERSEILSKNQLTSTLRPDLGTADRVLDAAEKHPLPTWSDRIAAVDKHLADARADAARLHEPRAVHIKPPSGTIRSEEDIEAYLTRLREKLATALAEHGAIII